MNILTKLAKATKELSNILDLQQLYKVTTRLSCFVLNCKKSCLIIKNKEQWIIGACYGFRIQNIPISTINNNLENWIIENQNILQQCFNVSNSNEFLSICLKKQAILFVATPIYKRGFQKRETEILQIFINFIELCLENAKLYDKANHDFLTGLYTRTYFHEYLSKNSIASSSILLLDIDFFKKINDTYGHLVGDKVLYKVASICKESIRREDIAVRYGGEEFIILLENASNSIAQLVAERIRKKIEEIKQIDNLTLSFTVSIGISSYKKNQTPIELIQQADSALYQAKFLGRNQIQIYTKFSNSKEP